MRWSLLALVAFSGCAALNAGATPPPSPAEPPSPAARLRDAVLKGSRAQEYTRALADRIGPRLAGSPNDARAVAWAKGAMETIGLGEVRAEPVKVPHWVRGVETAQVVSPAPQPLAVTAIGGGSSPPAGRPR